MEIDEKSWFFLLLATSVVAMVDMMTFVAPNVAIGS